MFDGFRFTINAPNVQPIQKTKDAKAAVQFTGLEAGHEYTVTMVTYSGEETSQKKTVHITTCKLIELLKHYYQNTHPRV